MIPIYSEKHIKPSVYSFYSGIMLNPVYRKVLYIILWYLVYPQLWYLIIIPEIFFDPKNFIFLLTILISYIFGIIDTYFRPFSESIRRDISKNPIYKNI